MSTRVHRRQVADIEATPGLSPAQKAITYSRVVDLSRVIHPDIPRWPGDPPVEFETVSRIEPDGFYLRRFSMGEHSATHLNAPVSFHAGGASIDSYPPESLVVPAVVIDVRDQVAADADYRLTVVHALAWEDRHGPVPEGCAALLLTGWQSRWNTSRDFLGEDREGNFHFPGFGLEAARLLLEARGAAGLGIDTHGVDPGADTTFAVNRLALERPRLALENLTNLEQLPPVGATLVIGILRLRGGSGAPVSALAFVP